MKLSFRTAVKEDTKQILSLYKRAQSNKYCVWNEYYPTILEIDHDLHTNNLYVLTLLNQIIGAISIVPENEMDHFDCWKDKEGKEIARVVIDQAYQGHGLSYEMVQYIIPILRQKGYQSIHLSVVKANIPAYKTYKKAGFIIVGQTQMYGHDYYLMEKNI